MTIKDETTTMPPAAAEAVAVARDIAADIEATEDPKDKNTVYEKIEFTPTHEINRSFPVLLADNAKMSLMIWDKFCDKIDDCTSVLGKVDLVVKILWVLVIALLILNGTGWRFNDEQNAIYGFLVPAACICFVLLCTIDSHYNKKVASRITNACASASNHDRDLTLTLKGDSKDDWYIEVAVRNAVDVEAMMSSTTATPIAVGQPVGSGPPPKKYVKGEDGKLMLNPEYTVWKNAQ